MLVENPLHAKTRKCFEFIDQTNKTRLDVMDGWLVGRGGFASTIY